MSLINFGSAPTMLSCAPTMSSRTFRVLAPRAKLLIIILAVVCCSHRTSANHHQLSRTIQPNTDEETQQKAAMDVIRRLIADKADDVAIKINFNLPGNYFKVRNFAPSMHKFSFIMSYRRASLPKAPQDKQLANTPHRGVQRCVGMQGAAALPEALLRRSSVVGRQSTSRARRVSDSKHRDESVERDNLLSERLHTLVQLLVVVVERMAKAHRLDRLFGHHADLGSLSGGCLDGSLQGLRPQPNRH
jgi:hypothetical protein